MRLADKLLQPLGLVTKATAQGLVNAAHEESVVARTNRPIYQPYDANYRIGKLPYTVLRSWAELCEPARLCINRVKTMMHTVGWDIVPEDEDAEVEDQVAMGKEWFSRQGGIGRPGTTIDEFLDELVEDLLVCGAVSMYQRPSVGRKAGLGGKIVSIEAIDAATIIPKRDTKGWIPEPPDVAYEQVLMNGQRTGFTVDELLYQIWSAKTHSPYGTSFVESCMMSILQFQAVDIYNLVWYTEGDMVLGYWKFTGSRDTSPQEVSAFKAWLRSQEHRAQAKGKSMADLIPPAGWEYQPFRPRSEADYLLTQRFLYQRICPFFGLTPSTLGFESDTFKSSEITQQQMAVTNALRPIASWLSNIFTNLLQGPLELPGVKFLFDTDIVDVLRLAQAFKQMGPATLTANERRALLGKPKMAGGLADEVYEMTMSGPVVIASTDPDKQIELPAGVVLSADDDHAPDATSGADDGDAGADGSGGDEAASTGATGEVVDKAGRAELYGWRRKVNKAVSAGKNGATVRFETLAVPDHVAADIRAALAAGVSPEGAFLPYLSRRAESNWQQVAKAQDALLRQIEAMAEAEEIAL